MKKRRSNGEGGLSWDKERQKWCGTLRDTNGKPHKFRHVDKVEVINWLNKMRLVYSSLNPLYSYDTTLQDFTFAFIKNKAANPKIAESTVNYYTYLAVSYTHLDVYKRQLYYFCNPLRFLNIFRYFFRSGRCWK